jgi:hypothetical protein
MEPAARIRTEAGLAFPCAGRVTHFVETPPIDPIWVARVELPMSCAKALEAVVAAKKVDPGTVDGALWETTPWWKPGRLISQKRFHFSQPEGSASVFVLLAEENGQLVAYLERDPF